MSRRLLGTLATAAVVILLAWQPWMPSKSELSDQDSDAVPRGATPPHTGPTLAGQPAPPEVRREARQQSLQLVFLDESRAGIDGVSFEITRLRPPESKHVLASGANGVAQLPNELAGEYCLLRLLSGPWTTTLRLFWAEGRVEAPCTRGTEVFLTVPSEPQWETAHVVFEVNGSAQVQALGGTRTRLGAFGPGQLVLKDVAGVPPRIDLVAILGKTSSVDLVYEPGQIATSKVTFELVPAPPDLRSCIGRVFWQQGPEREQYATALDEAQGLLSVDLPKGNFGVFVVCGNQSALQVFDVRPEVPTLTVRLNLRAGVALELADVDSRGLREARLAVVGSRQIADLAAIVGDSSATGRIRGLIALDRSIPPLQGLTWPASPPIGGVLRWEGLPPGSRVAPTLLYVDHERRLPPIELPTAGSMRVPVLPRLSATLSLPAEVPQADALRVRVFRHPKDQSKPVLLGDGWTRDRSVRIEAEAGVPELQVEFESGTHEGALHLVEPWRDQVIELRHLDLHERTIKVLDPAGKPLAGITLSLGRFYREPLSVRTDPDGVVRVALPRGEVVRAQVSGRDLSSRWAIVPEGSTLVLTAVVLGGVEVRNEGPDLEARLSISGQTTEALVPERTLRFLRGGRVKFERLPPGRYEVVVQQTDTPRAADVLRTEVEVGPGETAVATIK